MAKPIEVQGARAAAIFIERSYREGTDTQFLRELVQNGIEAEATTIQIGIHWQSADPSWELIDPPRDYPYVIAGGKYRLVYYDNGVGMGDRIVDYMAGLLDLDSKDQASGDLHGNFAMGVRVSTLPWNHAGVIVASWAEDYSEGQLVWLRYVEDGARAGSYEATTLGVADDDGNIDWRDVAPADLFEEFIGDRPEWLGRPDANGKIQTGTMLLMLGQTGSENTFLGPTEEWKTHTGPNYLSHRYYKFPKGLNIRYEDPRTARMDAWSERRRDRMDRTTLDHSEPKADDRVLNEPVRSTRDLMRGEFARRGASQIAKIPLESGGRIIVYLLPESSSTSGGGQRAAAQPAIGVRYKDEIYHRKTLARDYQKFAISHPKVYKRLSIIIEPRQADGVNDPLGGVFPSSARTSLQYVHPFASAIAGRDLPWSEWEQEFIDAMPDFVVAAIEAATPEESNDLDQDVIDRVAEPFMQMFSKAVWRAATGETPGRTTGEDARAPRGRRKVRSKSGQSAGTPLPSGVEGGDEAGRPARVRAGIPDCRFDAEAFSDEERLARPQVGVKYTKGRTGQLGSVVIDPHFPLIKDVEEYWLSRAPAPQHGEVRKAVQIVYRTAMACRVGQILSMAKKYEMSEDEITRTFMSNESLTASLFGLAAEHEGIKQRVGRKVKVKRVASSGNGPTGRGRHAKVD
ncbi:hypothetical protein [Gordonia caeni]|uniref:ATP-binding protein n=1 Tax=Gordonia caeni TaxID=1007097 RepID=A0ABP7PG13_9ACTN